MKKLFRNIMLTFFSLGMFFSCGAGAINIAHAAEQEQTPEQEKVETPITSKYIEGRYYQTPDNDGYYAKSEYEVKDGYSNVFGGSRNIGKLRIAGKFNHEQSKLEVDPNNYEHNDFYKYGTEDNISFYYDYNGRGFGGDRNQWRINTDSSVSIGGIDLNTTIETGVLVIEKSYDRVKFTQVIRPLVNFLRSQNGKTEPIYTTSGEDIGRGCYYRIRIGYESWRFVRTEGILWWQKDVYEYKNHLELYEFYIAKNTGIISLHNIGVDIPNPEDGTITPETKPEDNPSLNENESIESQNNNSYQSELLARGETLVDNSITNTGFEVDKLNNSSYKVMVSKDGEEEVEASDHQQFKEDGVYKVRTQTIFGKEIVNNITVFTGGEDKGFSTYFDDYVISGERMFDHGSLPTYDVDSKLYIKPVEDWMPAMQGSIYSYSTEEITEIAPTKTGFELQLAPDNYLAILYAGDPNEVGTVFKYEFRFKISPEASGPRVNRELLDNTKNLYDLQSKHYEVAIPTTKGGNIYVCFALESEEEAREYARLSEKRYIEKREGEEVYYYFSMENSKTKIPYTDPFELTKALNYYANKNVEIAYFDPTDKLSYQTYEGDLLNNIYEINIDTSVRVFPNEIEREKLTKRQRFLNDYTFMKAADFDVVNVAAKCEKDNRIYNLNFDEPVSKQLNITSKYTIIETNIYGDVSEYDCYYIKENTAVTTWEVVDDDVSSELVIDNSKMQDGKYVITCDTLAIKDISNELDEDTIITIQAPLVYSYELKCYTKEFLNIDLYKEGTYTIDIIDRLGNYYTIEANITGKTRHNKVTARKRLNYTNFYNSIYDNDFSLQEEVFLDDSALQLAINREVDFNIYLPSTVKNYKNRLSDAIATYKNPEATQIELDQATYDLNQAFAKLLPAIDRSELTTEINKFETADSTLYVTNTYATWKDAYDKAIIAYDDDTLNEVQLYELVLAMRKAHDALILRGIKTTLIDLLDEVNRIDINKYTPKTIEDLNASYLDGMKVYDNIDALQGEIDEIVKLIELKKNHLVERAKFDKLEDLINKVLSINKKNYTKASIANLKEKFDAAIVVFNDKNKDQNSIDDVYFALYDSFVEIVPIGDKEDLINLMYEISSLEQYMYTNKSINQLKSVYDECYSLLDNEISQSEVDGLFDKLTSAKEKLVIADRKELLKQALLDNKVEDLEIYNKKTSNAYVDAYNEVNRALHSLDDCDELTTNTLINHLVEAKENLSTQKIDWMEVGIFGGAGVGGLAIIITTICLIVKRHKRFR